MVLSMDRWIGKVAVVTGASSGIGAAIAESLVEQGVNVVGLARRQEKMEDLAKKTSGKKGKFYPLKTDVSKEEDILEAFKWIKENLGSVHILVNNAGMDRKNNLSEGKVEDWESVLRVNVIGLCIATREAIKDMKSNNTDGHIIHICGVLGHQVLNFPSINIYTASKFAVRALAEALRLELNSSESKIKITNLSPGGVHTEMATNQTSQEMKKIVETMLKEKQILDPEDVADGIIYALSTSPHVQVQQLTVRGVIEPF